MEAVDRQHSFIPLAMEEEMSIDEISKTPKGVDRTYCRHGKVQSSLIMMLYYLPTNYNGDHTTVTTKTRDLLLM